MINLLPLSQKTKIASEYKLRAATIVLGGIFIIEIFSAGAMGIIYQLISGNVKIVSAEMEQTKLRANKGSEKTIADMTVIKEDANRLMYSPNTVNQDPTELVRLISEKKPAGIVITGINYGAMGKEALLQVSGRADRREDLIFFQDNLKDPRIVSVAYDQSFVRTKTNIDFRLTIKLQ